MHALGPPVIRLLVPKLHLGMPVSLKLSVRRGITPVFRRCNQTAFDRVIVQILQLLKHHLVSDDSLRMRALLPKLMFAFAFVRARKYRSWLSSHSQLSCWSSSMRRRAVWRLKSARIRDNLGVE